MEQTILTPEQKTALAHIKNKQELAALFYLTGGTALAAFYLQHRVSDDLDFFTDVSLFPQLQVEKTVQELKEALNASAVEYRRLHDRRIFFFKREQGELKIEFSQYPFAALKPRISRDGLMIDSLQDIAAGKFMALIDRIESKDFVDLYFILKETEVVIPTLLQAVQKKFQVSFDPVVLGSEFAKVRAVSTLPLMRKPLSLEELKTFFADEARKLTPEIFRVEQSL